MNPGSPSIASNSRVIAGRGDMPMSPSAAPSTSTSSSGAGPPGLGARTTSLHRIPSLPTVHEYQQGQEEEERRKVAVVSGTPTRRTSRGAPRGRSVVTGSYDDENGDDDAYAFDYADLDQDDDEEKKDEESHVGAVPPVPGPQGEVVPQGLTRSLSYLSRASSSSSLASGSTTRDHGIVMSGSSNSLMHMASDSGNTNDPLSLPAHGARPFLPGPFVVFQGVPGDGMANYLDSMPLLEYHGSRTTSRRGSAASLGSANGAAGAGAGAGAAGGTATVGGGGVGGSFMEVDEDDCRGGGGSSGSDDNGNSSSSSSGSSSSSFPAEIRPSGSRDESDGDGSGESGESFQQVAADAGDGTANDGVGDGATTSNQGGGDGDGNGSSGEVLVLGSSSSASSSSASSRGDGAAANAERGSSAAAAAAGSASDNAATSAASASASAARSPVPPSRAAVEGRTTEGGLHLPIPPTMGCGGGSVLPPLGSPRAGQRPRAVTNADEIGTAAAAAAPPPPPPLAGGSSGAGDGGSGSGNNRGAGASAAAVNAARNVPAGMGLSESFIVVRDDEEEANEGRAGGASGPPEGETSTGPTEGDAASPRRDSSSSSSLSGRRRRRSTSRRRRSSSSNAAAADATTQTSSLPPSPSSSRMRTDSASGAGGVIGLDRTERRAVRHWNAERSERERRQREETVLDGYGYGVRRIGVGPRAATVAEATEEWWQRDGRLAVFEAMPRLDVREATEEKEGDAAPTPTVRVAHARIVSTLPPGAAVLASRMITVDSATLDPVPDAGHALGPLGCLRFLEITSPTAGYVLYGRDDGHAFLGPGLPGTYADPEVWPWRVTCPDGALIREGLELTTAHVETVPHGSLVRVMRKTVNSMGLSRLRVEAYIPSSGSGGNSDGAAGNGRKVVGWISESLNPLSGQRGPVVQPLPFPVPVRYRVRLPEGAVVRSDVELSSAQIGHAPLGAILTVVGRAYSEHPMDQCVERLRLAGGRGWVSVRLNRAPPLDETVVELVGLDGEYDPERAGPWHIQERRRVMEELREAQELAQAQEAVAAPGSMVVATGAPAGAGAGGHLAASVSNRLLRRTFSTAELSSIPDDESEYRADLGGGGPADPAASAVPAVPTLFRGGYTGAGPSGPSSIGGGAGMGSGMAVGGGAAMAPAPGVVPGAPMGGMLNPGRTETCLICLTEERNSTIVHGGTGHIACCLTCARILKARGDRCPVCRLPIDAVIQQFWA